MLDLIQGMRTLSVLANITDWAPEVLLPIALRWYKTTQDFTIKYHTNKNNQEFIQIP